MHRRGSRGSLLLLVVALLALPTLAADWTVTNTSNDGVGSLRQAIADANANPGPDRIVFAIPITDPNYNLSVNGEYRITLRTRLHLSDGGTNLDGSTQPGYAGLPLIELRSNEIADSAVIDVSGGDCTIRGLVIRSTGATDGIRLRTAGGNTVAGNYIGTDVTGTSTAGGERVGIEVESNGNTIGGTALGDLNLISGYQGGGVILNGDDNVVVGNFIGTDRSGKVALGNGAGEPGIRVEGDGNRIGGTTAAERNVISGNRSEGIRIQNGASLTAIGGNFIGVDVTGTGPLGNSRDGIRVASADVVMIGDGTVDGRNVIAHNGGDGIAVAGGTGVQIEANSIFENGELGIDLGNDGVTPNDLLDPDSGPNGLQNAPRLWAAASSLSASYFQAILESRPNTTYVVEFYSNTAADPSGYGEGQNSLGTTNVTTDREGFAYVSMVRPALAMADPIITATATDPDRNSSEFSNAITFGGAGRVSDVSVTKDDGSPYYVPGGTVEYTIVVTNRGSVPLVGATIKDSLGNIAQATSASWECTPDPGASCTAGPVSGHLTDLMDLPAGLSVTYTATLVIDSAATGDLINGVRVEMPTGYVDSNPADNTAFDIDTVAPADIAGVVFEDTNFLGTAEDWDSGANDLALDNVDVELYSDAGGFLATTTTDSSGRYRFSGLSQGNYKVRVRSATIGDLDTPPAGSLLPSVSTTWPYPLPEMTWGHGAPHLGGQSASVDDTSITNDAGPGDTWVAVSVNGVNVTTVNFGFAYNLIVNTLDDIRVNNVRSRQGSLRQFLKNANVIGTTGGTTANTSVFRIPLSSVNYDGSHYTVTLAAELPPVTDSTVVDAATQTGFVNRPLIQLNGNLTVPRGFHLSTGGGSTIRGFVINRFTSHGIGISAPGGNIIEGNWIGVTTGGTAASANGGAGIMIGDASVGNTIGGPADTQRNIISGSGWDGIDISSDTATGTVVRNNYIGTDVTGTVPLPNSQSGMDVDGHGTRVIDNLISGNDSTGLRLLADSGVVQGNLIGTDPGGNYVAALGNGGSGIATNGSGNLIGGTGAGEGNVIAGHPGDAISIYDGGGSGNSIRRNSTFRNGGIGVDLGPDMVTINDDGDVDSGPNDLLNYPILAAAVVQGADLRVTGFARPNSIVEFYIADGDAGGFGEGELFVLELVEGSVDDSDADVGDYGPTPIHGLNQGTDTTNRFEFVVPTPPGVVPGTVLTATATDGLNNTSEFGGQVTVGIAAGGPTSCNIFVDQDSWLWEWWPGVTYGGDNKLKCLEVANAEQRPVLRFDLSSIPAGSTITGATAWFNVKAADLSGLPVTIRRITKSWTEAGASWQDLASFFDPAIHGSMVVNIQGWHSVDLTALVQSWVAGTFPNDGLMMFAPTSDNIMFESKEGDPGEAACIELTFTPPDQADLIITNVIDDSTPDEGDTITYTVTVTNNGPDQVTSVSLDDVLPAGLTIGVVTPSAGTSWSAPTWTVGTLDATDSALLQIQATVDAGASSLPQPITNTVTNVTLDQVDSNATADDLSEDITVVPILSGRVLEDVDGDTVLGDAVAAGGVRVRLYSDDNDDGLVGPGDSFIEETTTALGTGNYSFQVDIGSNGTKYLVAVDSRTVPPSAGFNGGYDQDDVWAEQTYGDDPATSALDLAPRLGGRNPGIPDGVDAGSTVPADNEYQHLARVDLGSGNVSGVDFAFSFNVVTHRWDGPDADSSGERTRQGSLRQFVQNSNARPGPDSIVLPAETYVLTIAGSDDKAEKGDLDVDDDLTITGADTSSTVIDGGAIDRVLDIRVATLEMSDLTIRNADSPDKGGGVRNLATAILTRITISGNLAKEGAGIHTESGSFLTLVDSTVSGNTAENTGGGIDNQRGVATLINVTISGNSANKGGGIWLKDDTSLLNVTITENSASEGAGLNKEGGGVGASTARNTIIAGNFGDDCFDEFTSLGNNLDSDGTCNFPLTDAAPLLGSLQDNGGPTLTHALLDGSPAIDTGDDANCPGADQRGVPRPLEGDGDATPECDIGSYEFNGLIVSTDFWVTKTVDDATPDEGDTITYTVTVTNNGPAQVTGVSLDDVLPAGLTVGTVTPSAGTSWTAPTWTVGTLDAIDSATLQIQATVDAGASSLPQPITNTVTNVTLDQVDSGVTADDLSEDITVSNAADLVVTKTVDEANPDEGDTISYTVTVTNNGPAQVTSVSLDDVLPAGLTIGVVTPSAGTSWSAPTWTVGTLDAIDSATLTIQATVDAGASSLPQPITNTVTNVTLDQVDSGVTADDLSEDITVSNAADLVVTKTVDDATPDEGDTISYTVTVTNNGPAQVTSVSLDDVLPAGLTVGTVTPSAGTSWSAPTWTVGTLDAIDSATLTIQATVDAGASSLPQPITNTVTNVTLDQVDSGVTADDLSEDITVSNAADLVVTKTVDDATPDEGDTISYTVTVTNNGPAQVTSVSLDDVLPAGLTAGTITPSAGTSWTAPTWTVGTLDAIDSATLTIQATVDAGASSLAQPITNTVTSVTLEQVDSNATADDLSEDITVSNAADLVVTKTVDDANPDEGDTITYTVTVTNNGPAQVTSVSLDDVLPAGLTVGTVTPSAGTSWSAPTWTVGTLDATDSATLTIQATVDAGASSLPQPITNTVTNVTLDQVDSGVTADDLSEDITVSNAADLVVTKTVDDATPDEGDTISYTVTVTNNGPAQVTSVSLDDVLPAGLTAGTITPSAGTSWTAPTWTVGTLDAIDSATLTIQATVDAGASSLPQPITNTVTNVTLDQVDSGVTADDLSEDITVSNATDLVVTKTVDDATPDEGDTITYTVTVTNNGPAQVTSVSLDDVLPAGLTVGTVTPSAGTSWSAPTWTVGTLDATDSATLQIQATVDAGASSLAQPITNTVTNVTLDQVDSNATTDDLSEDITVGNAADLVVTKTVDDATPDEGDTITYTVTVTNNGPAQVTSVSLDDVLPAGLTIGVATPSAGTSWSAPTWTVGTLDATDSATLQIQATVDAGASSLPQPITNTVTNVTLDQVDSNATADDLSEDITVSNAADLVVTKTVDDANPDEGDTISYTVTVTNNGPAQVTSVSLDDVLPAGLTIGAVTPSAGTSWSAPTWTVGTLDATDSATLQIQATVDAGASSLPQPITNTVTNVTLDQVDSGVTADDLSEDITVSNAADLVVTKTVDDSTPDEGDTITYTVTVTNNGPAQVTSVSLDDVLPAGLTVGTVTPSAGTSWSAPTWTVGTLDATDSATLQIQATVDAGASSLAQPITNTVTSVTLEQVDSNATADDLSEDITVSNAADLVVTKTVDDSTPDEGDTISYTVTVTNNGPAQVTSVSLDDVLPAGLTVGTVTPSAGTSWSAPTWTVGTLDATDSATLTIQATVDAGASSLAQPITNTVTNVTLDQVDSNATVDDLSEDITVSNAADLVVTKTVDDANPDEGDTISYTVTVTNNGPAQVTSVSLDDVLPAGLTVGTVTPSAGTSWSAPTWTVGTLDATDSATLQIQATVDAGASSLAQPITNTVTNVTLDQVDSNATVDDLSEDITVSNAADLVVTKTVDEATPDEGDTISYTVTVTNNGPAQVTSVSLDDVLPAGLTVGTVTPSAGTSWSAPTWTVGTLDATDSATLQIQATVDAGASSLAQPITNTVTNVTLDQVDSNATADDLSEDITVSNAADLVVTKTVDEATPDEGDTISYTVTVTNNGPAQVTSVSLDDVLPAGLTIGVVTPSAGTSWSAPTWTVGTLDAIDSATLTIQATVDAGASSLPQPITNMVTNVTLDQVDSGVTADDLSEDITVSNAADLVVTKTVDDANPDEGDTISYTVTVTNNGPAQVTSVSLDDVLPAGLTVGTVTPSAGTSWTAPTWTVGTLDAIDSATLTIQATVDAGASSLAQPITNTVTNVTLDQVDSGVTADDLSEDITVSNAADLVVTKTVDDANPDEGDTISYTVTVTNNGPAQVTSVSLDDVLPAGLTIGVVTPSAGTSWSAPTWTVGTLDATDSALLQIQATVDAGASSLPQPITNMVTNVTLDQVDSGVTADDLSEDITVSNAADLVVTKTVDEANPDEGDTISYTVAVTNNGPAQVTSVSLDDVLPAGLTIGVVTPSAGTSWSAPTWTIGTLDATDSATLQIQVTVDAGASSLPQPITNTVTNVTLDQVDSNATVDDLSEDITVSNAADLVVTKTVDDATPDEGDTISYTVTVTNNGPAQVTSVSLDDVLPAGLTIGVVTPSAGTSWSAPTWTVGTLDATDSALLQIQATVDAGASSLPQPITNMVTNVTLDQVDSNATADDLSEDITVSNAADLVVTKTVDDATPDEGDTITYTVTVTNNGPAQVTSVSLDDVLPAGLAVGTVTPSAGTSWSAPTWTVGTLADGAAATLTLQATVDAGTGGTTITNTIANFSLDQVDSNATPDDLSEDITVSNAADLVVTKTVDDSTPQEGDTITYTVTVTNNGPTQTTNVRLDDVLPAGLTAGAAAPSAGTGWTAPTWTIGTLAVGSSATLLLDATVNPGTAGTTIANTVSNLTLDQTDSNATPDTLGVSLTVDNTIDLHVDKTVDEPDPNEGATIAYTITVTNHGPARATGVSLDDVLPAGVTAAGATRSQGSWSAPTWAIGALDAGASATMTLRATVDLGTGGTTITNSVTGVRLNQVDSDATPDSPSVDIIVLVPVAGHDGSVAITALSRPGDTLSLSVDDLDLDTDSALVETTQVVVTNDLTGETETVILTESAPSSPTFQASLPTLYNPTAGPSEDGTLETRAGDRLTARYVDEISLAGPTVNRTAIGSVEGGYQGTLTITSSIQAGDALVLTVNDADLNTDSGVAETVVVSVVNETTGESEAVTLTETAPNSGVFRGTLATTYGTTAGANNDGVLNTQAGDIVTATYNDQMSATGGPNTVLSAGLIGVQAVALSKEALQTDVLVGGAVAYELFATNTTLNPMTEVTIHDRSPLGFRLVENSATVTRAGPDGMLGTSDDVEEPIGVTPGRPLIFGPVDLAPGEQLYVRYLMRAGTGAARGEQVNEATPYRLTAPLGPSATAKVYVVTDPILDGSRIIGKVFEDRNENGRQDPGELGVPNAQVVLDSGTLVTTDRHGRYHVPAVSPGQRMVKLNKLSLPEGARIVTDRSRILWLTPGLTGRANFGVVLDRETESIGRPEETAVAVVGSTDHHPVEVLGRAEALTALVNGREVEFPVSDARLALRELDNLELSDDTFEQPVRFQVESDPASGAQRWSLTISDSTDHPVRVIQGEGTPPSTIDWDGRATDGALVRPGEVYQYRLEVEFLDGRSTSARRLFGVDRRSILAVELTGDAFETGKAELSPKAQNVLRMASTALRPYPDEPVLIEGHTDSIGSREKNLDLSRQRAEAAAAFLVNEMKFKPDRLVLRWFGEEHPVASNDLAEGREVNRRVDIRAEIHEIQDTPITDRYRDDPAVAINGDSLDLDAGSRFFTELPSEPSSELAIEMSDSQGRSAMRVVTLPELAIENPAGGFLVPYERSFDGCSVQPNAADAVTVVCDLVGRTTPGTNVWLDGDPLPTEADGSFRGRLHLAAGRNEFGLLARDSQGYARSANMIVTVADRDGHGELFVTTEGIPNLSVDLPPAGTRLRMSTLPLTGVTDPGNRVWVNDAELEVRDDGSFDGAAELPVGESDLVVRVEDPQGRTGSIQRPFVVAKHQLFLLAFADGEIGNLSKSGNLDSADLGEDGYYSRGRLAFYLKGKIQGKYLITAAFDSARNDNRLFSDLEGTATESLLTNLDPNRYYSVYGDDSSVTFDVQSQGKFYLALEGKEIGLVVGNFPLEINQTELSAYQRTLSGGRFVYRSAAETRYGAPNTEVVLFGADTGFVHVRDELRATGGSLYYLSSRDIIEGSEQVTLVVRDKNTGLVLSRHRQIQNSDYTVRYPEGRVMFHRPIISVAGSGTLFNEQLLTGHPVFIQIDYEKRASGFDEAAYGARASRQIGDHFKIGGTYVNDELERNSYELKGLDAEVRLAGNTRIIAEYSESTGTDSRGFLSADGGLTYSEVITDGTEEGDAIKVAADMDVGEWFGKAERYKVQLYYKDLGEGFFSSGNFLEQGTKKSGVHGAFRVTNRDSIEIRHDREERTGSDPLTDPDLERVLNSALWRHERKRWQLDVEYFSSDSETKTTGTMDDSAYASARLGWRFSEKVNGSLRHQQTLSGRDNDQTTLGVDYQVLPMLALQVRGTGGDQGNSAQAGAVATLGESEIYLTQRADDGASGQRTSTVLGARSPLGKASKIYSEYQLEDSDEGNRAISLLGIQRNWDPSPGYRFLFSGEMADVAGDTGETRRSTVGLGFTFGGHKSIQAMTRGEVRRETGDEQRLQLVTVNQFDYKLHDDLTLQLGYRYSKTEDTDLDLTEALLDERSVGLAYRPVFSDRFNALARYTRLEEQGPADRGRSAYGDDLMEVFSVETAFQFHRRIEWLAKGAARDLQQEFPGFPTVESRTFLLIQRFNFDVWRQLDATLEYRQLMEQEAKEQRGGLVGQVAWELIQHFRLGVGYNFTDFTDDEFSSNDQSASGWFLRIQGKY